MNQKSGLLYNDVYFIGLNPSKKNFNTKVPFIGTLSYWTLESWTKYLRKKYHFDRKLLNVSNRIDFKKPTVEELQILKSTLQNEEYIVALGNRVSNILTVLNIKHHKLPHPSPRNRLLNSKTFVHEELKKCREYLEKRSTRSPL